MSSAPSSTAMRAGARTIRSEPGDVGERMRARPDVQRVPSPGLELFIVKRFLDPRLCGELIERIDAERRPSTITDDIGADADFRTSETCDLDGTDPAVAQVDEAICG